MIGRSVTTQSPLLTWPAWGFPDKGAEAAGKSTTSPCDRTSLGRTVASVSDVKPSARFFLRVVLDL